MAEHEGQPTEAAALLQLAAKLEAESSDGLALLKNPKDNPICSIFVDENIPCVMVVWKRYATSTQLRFVHENIIDLLRKHGLTKIIGDDTDLPTIHQEDQSWIVNNWMPRAVSAGLRAAANKVPAAHFGRISVDSVKSAMSSNILMCSFEDIDEARKWIRNVDR